MRKLIKERKLFKGGNYMRKYGKFFLKMNGERDDAKQGCRKRGGGLIEGALVPTPPVVGRTVNPIITREA